MRRLFWTAVLGYLIGTFPSADLASRLATGGKVDLREAGSGNPGAANAMRELGKRWGLFVMVADIGKGAIGALVGRVLAGPTGGMVAGTAVVTGHIVPVWTGFRGGKGVSTAAGASLTLFPPAFPLEASVVSLGTKVANPARGIEVAAGVWVLAALLWWWRKWPNAWGLQPGIRLLAFTVASSLVMMAKLRQPGRIA
ncbi:MAG: glycerol-3-phosphate acyltransferase [Acidimicrobiales bacterium]